MKRLLDINTWIALTLETHLHHKASREWYDNAALTAGDLVYCRQTELGFLRLITQAKVMNRYSAEPMTNAQAIEFLANVYHDPAVARADEPPATRALWFQLAEGFESSPNVWMDAYLAAFAIALGAELVTFDRGFVSYERRGLRLVLLGTPKVCPTPPSRSSPNSAAYPRHSRGAGRCGRREVAAARC